MINTRYEFIFTYCNSKAKFKTIREFINHKEAIEYIDSIAYEGSKIENCIFNILNMNEVRQGSYQQNWNSKEGQETIKFFNNLNKEK